MSRTKAQLVSNIIGNVSGGASFTGIVTAAGGFSGSITGTASTASFATTSFGLSGSPNITVGVSTFSGIATHTASLFGTQASFSGVVTATTFSGNITGTAATFTGNVSIAGTLTYEDVTNVDSIGVVTARTGIVITGGGGINITGGSGIITATSYRGDGSQLTGVSAGLSLKQAGSVVAGGAATTVNFASGATITSVSSGIATITIAAGIVTEALVSSGIVTTLSLSSAQDHKVTATGITTITVSGGTEGDSHTVRIVNSGIATVGFSTYFLFPSGSAPVLPTTSGAISLLSFTVHRVGTAGTQLLAGASLNFS